MFGGVYKLAAVEDDPLSDAIAALEEGGMDAVVRRLADPHERETLAHRIEDGGGFDDIAKLAGWDGIFLSSLHCPEDEQFLGKGIAEEIYRMPNSFGGYQQIDTAAFFR